jgi:hypothetical protein
LAEHCAALQLLLKCLNAVLQLPAAACATSKEPRPTATMFCSCTLLETCAPSMIPQQ